jgi:hypothetical protein
MAVSRADLMLGTAGASAYGGGDGDGSWFLALARAWGTTLDRQATRIQELSDQLGQGVDKPSQVAELTAESLRLSFLAQSTNTSVDSVGRGLETVARKQ